jgi:hypothetical protein
MPIHHSFFGNLQPSLSYTNEYSIQLDGVDDHVEIANHSSLNINDKFSVFAWIKLDDLAAVRSLCGKWGGGFNSHFVIYVTTNGAFNGRVSQGAFAKTRTSATGVITAGSWYHVGMIFDRYAAGDRLRIFINGTEDTTNADPTIDANLDTSTTSLYLGTHALTSWTKGKLDEVTFWSTNVLTPTDINTLFNGGTPINPTTIGTSATLVSWWRCGDDPADDGTKDTGVINDQIGSNNGIPRNNIADIINGDAP